MSCPLECSLYPEGARREHTHTHTHTHCMHSCKHHAHTHCMHAHTHRLHVMHHFTWDSGLLIELQRRNGRERDRRETQGGQRAREVESETKRRRERERCLLIDWQTVQENEGRKESEIFPQLSVRVLMWFKGFFMLRNFEGEAFDV